MFLLPRLSIFLICTLFLLNSCYKPNDKIVLRTYSPNLEESYAAFRARQISDIEYHFNIDITDRERFRGEANIVFSLAKGNLSPITLDFQKGDISSIKVNQKQVEFQYESWFIELPPQLFTPGKNTVEVHYNRPYSSDGQGLHQYKDHSSGNHYLYTQFEAYAANHFTPLFDQPDLKAIYSMSVTAPADWEVISATRESTITSVDAQSKVWHFPKTQLIPSYIYSLHAGPFHIWHDEYQSVPFRLFAREEMAKFVDFEEWRSATRQSFAFLQDFFEFPYPFNKYDQVIVPDFNFGAMENVGAVTFAERFLKRGEKTEAERFRLANVIAHEMAHMWFGNVVTMTWWNDLWLNESFATYMAFATVSTIPDFPNAWDHFSSLKGWAYYEDQLVTTHPIVMPIDNSGSVMNAVDGISYAKGASVLKQLSHYVGKDAFRQAIVNYVKEHQYSNTTLVDLVKAIEKTSKKDMSAWVNEWLLTPGLNSVSTEFQCESDRLTNITILQHAPEDWPTMRTQRVQLALYQQQQDSMVLKQVIPVTYRGHKTQVNPIENYPCPDIIYPNHEDWGYLKPLYTDNSINILEQSISQFDKPLQRLAFWRTLWSQVHDAKLPVSRFFSALNKNISEESDSTILNYVLGHSQIAFNLIESMPLKEEALSQKALLEMILWREFSQSDQGSERQKLFYQTAVSVSFSETALAQIRNHLKHKSINKLNIDQDLRWEMIKQLNRYNYSGSTQLIEAEKLNDTSDRGRIAALSAEAIRPDFRIKQQWTKTILDPQTEIKLSDLRSVMRHLFPGEQADFRNSLADEIVEKAVVLTEVKDDIFFKVFADYMLPSNCTEMSNQKLQTMLNRTQNQSAMLTKKLRIALQNDRRCLKQADLLYSTLAGHESVKKPL